MKKVYKEEVRRKGVRLTSLKAMIIVCIIVAAIVGVFVINLKIDTSTQYVQIFTQYDYKITATMFNRDISSLIDVEGSVDTTKMGEYTIKYVFKNLKFLVAFERKVVVVDMEPPTITLNGDSEIHVYDINYYEEPGYRANDVVDGELTKEVYTKQEMISENEYVIKYFCEDSSKNVATATRTVYIDSKIGDVYLTFDDGPSSVTESVLKTLKQKGVNATFFIVGYSTENEYLVKQEYEDGNTIGLHGLTHEYSKIYTSPETVLQNFDSLKEILRNTLGTDTCFIRFPGGSSNTISKKYCKGVMTKATQLALEKGYVYFDWNVDSEDAGGAKTSEEIYQNVINGIKPGRTNVVLMHDSSGHKVTAEALPSIIDWCLKNGYEIKSITDTTPAITHQTIN